MSTTPAPAPGPPAWSHCGHGAHPATDPVGCPGIRVPRQTACLAHLNDNDRDAYLTGLNPGADIDHRGTSFTPILLEALLQALQDPTTQNFRFGDAVFHQARFSGLAMFSRAQFSGGAVFSGAQFCGDAVFEQAQFSDEARFENAQFSGGAIFDQAQFSSLAQFGRAQFSGLARFDQAQVSGNAGFSHARFVGDAGFSGAQFAGDTWFYRARFADSVRFNQARFSGVAEFGRARFSGGAQFSGAQFSSTARFTEAHVTGDAVFDWATFSGPAWFDGARFAGHVAFVRTRFAEMTRFGPVVCAGTVDLSGAVFEIPVTLEIAAGDEVRCMRTRWESTATLRLRYATVDLSYAVLSFPVAVTAHPAPFIDTETGTSVAEELLQTSEHGVRVVSVRGVDAAHLVLTDTDLSNCLFSGSFHLDQLRLEGDCIFAETPAAVRWFPRLMRRWSARRILAEEHHWRAQSTRSTRTLGWMPPPETVAVLKPAALAALYRQIRKSLEDGKNEPDAADFYYGEMEMRRHDATRSTGEHALLTAYYVLSGYGLRALRALAWLGVAMTVTVLVMMLFGIPKDDPKPETTGTQTGSRIILTTDTPPAVNPTGPWASRITTDRLEKSLRVVINSVVFRSSGQNLTTAGTYAEMISRFTEPVLLALAVLAMRSRIKR